MKRSFMICLAVLLCSSAIAAMAPGRGPVRPRALDIANPNIENRVHREGNVWMNITNYGYFGNSGPEQNNGMEDPCPPGSWAPQGEFPGGSDQQYLYQGALWIGALIMENENSIPRVSVGTDGWFGVNELYPGEGEANGIVERSNIPGKINCFAENVYDPMADANEEFIATYSDTLTDPFWVYEDPADGPHRSLNLEVTQRSMAWNSFEFNDFIIFEFTVLNMGSEFLRNLYLGLYVDSDVGPGHEFEHHTDDISGFLTVDTLTGEMVNIPFSADNDGWASDDPGGPLVSPHVAGMYVLSSSQPDLRWSFNWWASNGDLALDFGPAWQAYGARDSLGMGWTAEYGTPVGDQHKYDLLCNREVDYDQWMVNRLDEVPPQHLTQPDGSEIDEPWYIEDSPVVDDIADGYDTRYLFSCGPLGIFDYIDPQGNRIYRLNPGEEFTFTVAYVFGRDFHNVNNPQIPGQPIDPSKFDFTDLLHNARRARLLFNSNYAYQPPVYPPDFRPTGVQSNAVPLAWNVPSIGTVQGYNVYGVLGDGAPVRFNSQLIPVTVVTIDNLTNGDDWLFLAQTVDDSGIMSGYADTLVRVGAPLPVTGLTAELEGSVVFLSWNVNTDPALIGYRVLRRSNVPGDSVSLAAPQTSYLDVTAQVGRIYTYWVVAENSRGLQSFAVDSVIMIPWAPQHRILVIDETDSVTAIGLLQGGISDDSVAALYSWLMNASGEDFDILEQRGSQMPMYSYESLAQYDLVIWHSEDNGLTFIQDGIVEAREEILRTYVHAGGRLLRIARRFLSNLNVSGRQPGAYVVNDYLAPLTFDSVNAAARFSLSHPGDMRLIGANAEDPNFPSVALDTSRLHQIRFNTLVPDFLPEIDTYWPSGETHSLYRSVVHPSDSSGLANQPVAVLGNREILLGFPLYFLHEEDAQTLLTAAITALRTYTFDVPDVPAPSLPVSVRLEQNYPNPFNSSTTLRFDLPQAGPVRLAIYNLLGQEVRVLTDAVYDGGVHTLYWDGSDASGNTLTSGLYLARLVTPSAVRTTKVILLR